MDTDTVAASAASLSHSRPQVLREGTVVATRTSLSAMPTATLVATTTSSEARETGENISTPAIPSVTLALSTVRGSTLPQITITTLRPESISISDGPQNTTDVPESDVSSAATSTIATDVVVVGSSTTPKDPAPAPQSATFAPSLTSSISIVSEIVSASTLPTLSSPATSIIQISASTLIPLNKTSIISTSFAANLVPKLATSNPTVANDPQQISPPATMNATPWIASGTVIIALALVAVGLFLVRVKRGRENRQSGNHNDEESDDCAMYANRLVHGHHLARATPTQGMSLVSPRPFLPPIPPPQVLHIQHPSPITHVHQSNQVAHMPSHPLMQHPTHPYHMVQVQQQLLHQNVLFDPFNGDNHAVLALAAPNRETLYSDAQRDSISSLPRNAIPRPPLSKRSERRSSRDTVQRVRERRATLEKGEARKSPLGRLRPMTLDSSSESDAASMLSLDPRYSYYSDFWRRKAEGTNGDDDADTVKHHSVYDNHL